MKSLLRAAAVLAALVLPMVSHAAFISGDLTGGGNFSGTVTRADAWAASNPVDGTDVNFWTLNGQAGDTISIIVSSSVIEFGVSLYQGLVDEFELLVPGFDNAGSFADNLFVAGTPFFGATGTELLNIVLPASGMYTLAVGGESFDFGSSFAYNMNVSVAPVPLPAAVWLLGSALLGMGVLRRRQA